ncbi:hypothetical protein J0X15_14795 [Roseibium sp. CAU 1637]|uniref:Uncharacterized protein n=1 Tax=Roseibium limicola TaxID=2816037 RepID=A0A939EPW3_9HYPH|nr:hypothetical protein [Roseibium limicola]MBO0346499.1 hypothetical protein [Roseibium limicola]
MEYFYFTSCIFYCVIFSFLYFPGSEFVKFIMGLHPEEPKEWTFSVFINQCEDSRIDKSAGALVGALERFLIAGGLLIGRWEVLAAVIALKSVSRFKQLDDRRTAERFLVGSLASLVWTVGVYLLLLIYDQTLGFGLFPQGLLIGFG